MSARWIACRALVRKDVLSFVRDRRALVVSVLTPILIAAFFGYLFGGDRDEAARGRMPVAVVDRDGSEASRQVLAGLAGEPSLRVEALDADGARAGVRAGQLRVAVLLPAGFGAAARRALFGGGDKPVVELLYDPSQPFARPVVEGLLTLHVMQAVSRELFAASGSTAAIDATLADVRASARLAPERRAELTRLLEALREFESHPPPAGGAGAPAPGLAVPFGLSGVPVSAGPRYNGYAHSFAGMSVQFILFMGIDAGVGILLQRQQGVWRRLRAAPLSRGLLLGARCAATALIAVGILAAVYLVAGLAFGVRIEGSVAGFVAVAVAFALFTSATGLLVAALGRSVPATRGLATFVVLLLVMLGGAWVPSFVFPAWLQRATLFVPTRWAVDGLDAMTWRGLPAAAAVAPVAVLAGSALVFAALALWRFDWDAD
ncbi:MAG TPA: ABC transporter permease [Steroidobacteraceae bacterium]|nr:ABC transporter permease [Steroidobacteraceae bacterium]